MSKEMRMHSAENQRTSSWLGKALCRRYALVHFAEFNVLSMEILNLLTEDEKGFPNEALSALL